MLNTTNSTARHQNVWMLQANDAAISATSFQDGTLTQWKAFKSCKKRICFVLTATSMKKTKYKNSTTRSHKCTVHKRHCAPYGKGIKVDSNSQRKTTFQSYQSENLNTNTHFTQHKLHHLKFYTKFRQHNWHSLRKSIIGHTSEPYFERL